MVKPSNPAGWASPAVSCVSDAFQLTEECQCRDVLAAFAVLGVHTAMLESEAIAQARGSVQQHVVDRAVRLGKAEGGSVGVGVGRCVLHYVAGFLASLLDPQQADKPVWKYCIDRCCGVRGLVVDVFMREPPD